jgi:hypothetical protein
MKGSHTLAALRDTLLPGEFRVSAATRLREAHA